MNFLDARLPDRFWSQCSPIPVTGCWLWHGVLNDKGYGILRWSGRPRMRAHRLSYITLVGTIADGLELDHRVCQTPSCVNPAHLEAVTHAVNMARGRAGLFTIKRQRSKTHCAQGHEFSEANTYVTKKGHRQCRTCTRDRIKDAYHRNQENRRRPL